MTESIEFVNDWTELENCINVMSNWAVEPDSQWVVDVVVEYVPRLLTQYASLLETSYALTEGWEQYVKLHPPTGIFLPGHK